jgi:predicted CXXCH cytochrome family protein
MDATLVTGGCRACHQGHGLSRSPMLPAPQSEVCLACHSTRAAADAMTARGLLSPTADPPLLSLALSQPFLHPVDDRFFSRGQPGVVTCTSCHSPHRQSIRSVPLEASSAGQPKLSTRNPTTYETELCGSCHGSAGVTTQSLLDLSRLTNPNNRSFHPVEAPAAERSPSVLPELRDRQVNCTDCHGNSDPGGARGPHGSAVRYLLRREYVTIDGSPEGAGSYGLCYSCHERQAVLESGPFPLHRLHVVDELVSCATCHSAHGSVENRALIRFGEETILANVGPSGSAGRLEYISTGPGSGSCFVSCHGVDHAPASYGSAGLVSAPLLVPAPGSAPFGVPPDASSRSTPPRRPPPPSRPPPSRKPPPGS